MSLDPLQLPEPTPAPKQAWMLTFADLLSLLLTFFVMMYAMSQIEQVRWQEYTDSLTARLNPSQKSEYLVQQPETLTVKRKPLANDLSYLHTVMLERMENQKVFKGITLQRRERELVIMLPQQSLFDSGNLGMSAQGREMINGLSETLGLIGNQIEIATDVGRPAPKGKEYILEWELSLTRAANLAQALHEAGYAYGINLLGYGERNRRNSPLAVADSRVEIVIRERQAGP